ncbi:MAG: site-specific DNA-methyltransferase [Pirellulales bacterium]|nr:site-specific DNA-methyltransferase [Pirellulales bacterium]
MTKANQVVYTTEYGRQLCGDSRELIAELPDESVDLIVTSPPFALLRKKKYGNKEQAEYIAWLREFGQAVYPALKPAGSFVLDLGGAYVKGHPVRSLYNFRVLLDFCDTIGYFLAEDFYWHNPAKLPSPIEWVNKAKERVKDSVNTIWWFSKTERPKADVRKVYAPYSERMKKLLENPSKFYTPAKRPSGHDIADRFGDKENKGAIPPNLLQIPNTDSNSFYMRTCKALKRERHPARFPADVPRFFIEFLTDPGDLVVDIFSGSNTTGYVAEGLGRKWISMELNRDYAALSAIRFMEDKDVEEIAALLEEMESKKSVILRPTILLPGPKINGVPLKEKPTKMRRKKPKPMPLFD